MNPLDTGADEIVFPDADALTLGLDLSNAPTNTMRGATGSTTTLRYASVTLRLADTLHQYEWPAIVGFTAAPLRRALFGFAHGLQFFNAHFLGADRVVELTPNADYLDTNAWITYLRRPHSPIVSRLRQQTPATVAVCSVVVAELFYGCWRSARPTECFAQVTAVMGP